MAYRTNGKKETERERERERERDNKINQKGEGGSNFREMLSKSANETHTYLCRTNTLNDLWIR